MTETGAGKYSSRPVGDYARGDYLLTSSDPNQNVDPSEDTGQQTNVDPSEGGVDPSEGTPGTCGRVDPSEDPGLVGPDPWDD